MYGSLLHLLFIDINIYRTCNYRNDTTVSMELQSNPVAISQSIREQINTNE